MAETIRYTRLGKEDLNFGTGTFEARLADGRVVTLSQINLALILSDPALSSRSISLDAITVQALLTSTLFVVGTLHVPNKSDPSTPAIGEIWVNSGSEFLEYGDGQAVPVKHQLVGHDTVQTLTNKTLDSSVFATPVLSGTITGTYALGGTPSLAAPLDASDEDITGIDELALIDAAAIPTATGRLRRSGNELLWRPALGAMRVFYGEAGTVMLFQQTTAPTGWTKLVTHNDKALRVVSGSASSGGATAFTSVFGSGLTTGAHTLDTTQIPAHTHAASRANAAAANAVGAADGLTGTTISTSSGSAGGGGAHSHTLSMDLHYVDVILAEKD